MSSRRSGCGLLLPLFLVLLVAGGWTVWWNVLASQLRSGLDRQVAALEAAGWEISHDPVQTTGFPFRIELGVANLDAVTPSGHGLRAPRLSAESLAYQPDRWVIVASEGLSLGRGAKGWTAVTGEALRASVSSLDRQPPRLVIEFDQPRFAAEAGAEPFPIAGADSLVINLLPRDAGSRQAGLLFDLVNAEPRPGGALAEMSERRRFNLRAEAVAEEALSLSGPTWSRALSSWRDAGGALTDVRIEATAGEDFARGQSERLTGDASGRLSGELGLNLRGGTAPLAGLARAPGVDPRAAAAVRFGAQLTGGLRGETSLTLRFADGRTIIGPVNLGPAPKLF